MAFPTLPLKSKNILVVDDSAEVRNAVSRLLESEGYVVHQAANGQVALKAMQWVTPDLILSDINMPVMSGFRFYKELHKNPRWVSIPFIFLTSLSSPEDVQAGRELGVEDYLTKPVDPLALVKIVSARLLRFAQVQIALVDQAYLDTVTVLAKTIEGRDPHTYGHIDRVVKYARWLAEALDWPADLMRWLEFGARLHDIGKIIVPDQHLKKTGPLTAEEWHIMKQHPEAGAKILHDIGYLNDAIPYVLYHHERWDGKGYPFGMHGRDIPIEGRMMAIVDVYDALTTDRPYHPAMPYAEVTTYLQAKGGTIFDPELVSIFVQILRDRQQEFEALQAS
jgi:putative two-component system response regulator